MLIVDGSHLLHRNLRAMIDLVNTKGLKTGGLHGFFISLGSLARKFRYNHGFIICWDEGCSKYRKSIYPTYKDGRLPGAEISHQELDPFEVELEKIYDYSRKLLHEALLPLCGCVSLEVKNVEADDIAAWIVNNINCEDKKILVTSDDDWMQLIRDKVFYFNPMKNKPDGKLYDKQEFIEERDLIPEIYKEHFLLAKSIMGDGFEAPGVKGLGKVWATRISRIILEDGEDALDPKKPKYKLYLDNKKDVELSRKLVDLDLLPQEEKDKIREEVKTMSSLTTDLSSEKLLHNKLHSMELRKAREQVSDIIDSNMKTKIQSTLKELVFNL